MRLLAGVLASAPFQTELHGDASLTARPMERVADPLRAMGADVRTTDGHPPIAVRGEPGEQDGALDLSARDLGTVLDPAEAAPPDHDRRVPVRRSNVGAHRPQRGGDPLHRPDVQARVPVQLGLEGRRGEHPGQQAHRRARVRTLEWVVGGVKRSSTVALEHEV